MVDVGGITSFGEEGMAVFFNLNEMFTDGHTDGKLSVTIGSDGFSVLGAQRSVHIETASLDGIVGMLIEDRSADGEGGYVGEISGVMYQRVVADKT